MECYKSTEFSSTDRYLKILVQMTHHLENNIYKHHRKKKREISIELDCPAIMF